MTAENLRKFRRELGKADADFMVMKKRLLKILLKEKGVEVDLAPFKVSIGTIFSQGDIEKISGPAVSFMAKLEPMEGGAKDMWVKRLVAGYDMKRRRQFPRRRSSTSASCRRARSSWPSCLASCPRRCVHSYISSIRNQNKQTKRSYLI